jgi:hypothetical protein
MPAKWNLAIAYSHAGSEFHATVDSIQVAGLPGFWDLHFPTLADALADLVNDGWEPFSAYRDEFTLNYVLDYVWFRREVKCEDAQPKRGGTAQEASPKPRP